MDGIKSVSYTHLDVYKRQIFRRYTWIYLYFTVFIKHYKIFIKIRRCFHKWQNRAMQILLVIGVQIVSVIMLCKPARRTRPIKNYGNNLIWIRHIRRCTCLLYTSPVIKQGNDTFTTNSYHTVAQAQTTDNVITVNYKKVKKSDLKSFNISGTVVSKNASIRDNGLEPESLPLVGYSVSAGKGSQSLNSANSSYMPDSATGTTSDTGTYILTNVLGDTNDLITMYISNGVTTCLLYTSRCV